MDMTAKHQIKLLIFQQRNDRFLTEKPMTDPEDRMIFIHGIVSNQNLGDIRIFSAFSGNKIPVF